MSTATAVAALPSMRLGHLEVSRLIVGGNPFRGYSHLTADLDNEMASYHTREQIVATLFASQEAGMTAMVMRADAIIYAAVDAYYQAGGTMRWIAQTASENRDVPSNIREAKAHGASALYFHGTRADHIYQAGEIATVREYLKVARDLGLAVGIAAHLPEVHRLVADQDWDLDFHMCCFYNLGKIARGSILAGAKRVDEPFDLEDREIICDFIRQRQKPCLAYKILGAGRQCDSPGQVRDAFAWAFAHIKPGDGVVVGMYQRHRDQVAENAAIVRELAG